MNYRLLLLVGADLERARHRFCSREATKIFPPPPRPRQMQWKSHYKFSGDFTVEQAYLGDADVQRGGRRG